MNLAGELVITKAIYGQLSMKLSQNVAKILSDLNNISEDVLSIESSLANLHSEKDSNQFDTLLACLANLKEAIADSVEHNPELKTRYIKLSWMGMGDALNKPDMVYYVTLELLNWVFSNGYAAGLDGVDLSTVYPKNTSDAWIPIFQKLDKDLRQFKLNPIYSMDNVEYSNSQYSHENVS